MTQEWLWVSQWGEASVGASPRVSRYGGASDGASPFELGGEQGEFQDGGANVWTSPCKFWW